MEVVAKIPHIDENSFGQHFGLGRSPNLGHVYGLERSSNYCLQCPRPINCMLLPNNAVIAT
jgi:hypothetical protein